MTTTKKSKGQETENNKEQETENKASKEENAQEEVCEAAEDTQAQNALQGEVDSIIRKRVYASMAIGLAPIPLVDFVGLTAVQINLVRALAKKYDVPFKGNRAKTIVASLVASVLPVGVTPVFASLIKFIPVIGYTTGAVSMSLLGGASTYAIGKVFSAHFASGGTLLDLKAEKVKAGFKEQFEKGKSYASSMKKKKASEETAEETSESEAAGHDKEEAQPA